MKIRVLASQFQLELIRRMGGSPIAMTLADVLPGLQQGTIDGTLTTMTIYTTMHYYDVGKFVIQTDQPYVNSFGAVSKTAARRKELLHVLAVSGEARVDELAETLSVGPATVRRPLRGRGASSAAAVARSHGAARRDDWATE